MAPPIPTCRKYLSGAPTIGLHRWNSINTQEMLAPLLGFTGAEKFTYDSQDAILPGSAHDFWRAGTGWGGHACRLAALRRHTIFVALQRTGPNQCQQPEGAGARLDVPDRRLCREFTGHAHRCGWSDVRDHGPRPCFRFGRGHGERDLAISIPRATA